MHCLLHHSNFEHCGCAEKFSRPTNFKKFNYANIFAEVGKAQSEAQGATSSTSAIAEVAFRFNFYFETLRKLRCELKALKFLAL